MDLSWENSGELLGAAAWVLIVVATLRVLPSQAVCELTWCVEIDCESQNPYQSAGLAVRGRGGSGSTSGS